jgi:hypothetical protein
LLDSNIRSSKYTIDSAQRARQYLISGNDPQQFSEWNERYWPRAQTVNSPTQPIRPGQSQSGAASATKDSGGFVPGKTYRDKSGNTATYLGNGKWQ